jgi:serine/threonine protein kinase
MATGRLPWESEDREGMVREILEGAINFPNEFPEELKPFVRLCTNLNPAERPRSTDLLDLPWIAAEVPAYNRVFGPVAKVPRSAASDGWKTVGPVVKQSARMILMKPQLRSLSADRAKQSSLLKPETLQGDRD